MKSKDQKMWYAQTNIIIIEVANLFEKLHKDIPNNIEKNKKEKIKLLYATTIFKEYIFFS